MAKKEADVAKKISTNQRIKELEEELSKTKVNKRTEASVGMLKAKIAKLKDKEEQRVAKGRGAGDGYAVRKTGDGTAVLLGFPSVGKSTLLNSLTNQDSPVGAYAFTTLTVIPGLLKFNHAKIQVLDVPGIVQGAAAGTGRGKEVLQVIRNADLIMVIVDVFHPEHLPIIHKEIFDAGVRINQTSPDVKIVKKEKGGIDIGSTVRLTHLTEDTIVNIFKEFRIQNADIVIREDITHDQLIDVLQANKVYAKSITVLNKADMVDEQTLQKVKQQVQADMCISAHKKQNLEELKQLIFDHMKYIRVFLKEVNKPADMEEPMIMQKGDTLHTLCEKLHRDFVTKFRYARIWGPSAKFDGQVKRNLKHELKDNDVIEIHLK